MSTESTDITLKISKRNVGKRVWGETSVTECLTRELKNKVIREDFLFLHDAIPLGFIFCEL